MQVSLPLQTLGRGARAPFKAPSPTEPGAGVHQQHDWEAQRCGGDGWEGAEGTVGPLGHPGHFPGTGDGAENVEQWEQPQEEFTG